MSFLSAVTDVLRPRPAARETKTDTRVSASPEPSARERQAMLHLSNVSHAVNHFQNQMMTMLYPYIMADLGMTYTAVGVLSAICSMLSSICQGAYGFLTPFSSRCKLLGFGNLGIALGTLMSGLAGSYPMLIVARGVASIGSSATRRTIRSHEAASLHSDRLEPSHDRSRTRCRSIVKDSLG